MVTVRTGASPQDVLQGAKHVLFVEGTTGGLDVAVLEELLGLRLRVEPLGPSFSVRSVAQALRDHHPEYWFVIDRDDWDDEAVEASWQRFPDPAHDNLLIWRRKELESYFLEPEWVSRSRYLRPAVTPDQLKVWIASEANQRLWLEAANRVLIKARIAVKQRRASVFKASEARGLDREQVLDRLLGSPQLASLRSATSIDLSEERIRVAFDEEVDRLSGGAIPLAWGTGRWRDLGSAKPLFRGMTNQWFHVPDQSKPERPRLTGRDAERAIAVELLRHHQDAMPTDLGELRVIMGRVA